MSFAEQVIHGGGGTAVLVGVDGRAVVGRALVDEHERQLLGRYEIVEIGDAVLHGDDDAVHRQLFHPFGDGLQRLDVAVTDGDQRGSVTIVFGGFDDAVQDAGVAEGGHIEQHDADVLELAMLQRACRVVGAVSELFHGGLDALPSFRAYRIAAVGHAGDGLGRYPCLSGHVLHGRR